VVRRPNTRVCNYHVDDTTKLTIKAKLSKDSPFRFLISCNPKGFAVWQKPKSKRGQKYKVADLEVHTIIESCHLKPVKSSAFEPDARARAILRGREISETDLGSAGGTYDLEEVRKLMGDVSRQSIEKRVREKSLLAVPGPSNRRRYPTIQFNADGTVVHGLQAVLSALDFESPWAVLNFLVNSDDRLNNDRPIDALRRGDVDLVLESARGMGEQGA
jgi:hypothetical protein